MLEMNWLSPDESGALFGAVGCHAPAAMVPFERPKLLWLNEACARNDPYFANFSGDLAGYEAHLVRTCAYRIAVEHEGEEAARHGSVTAFADRYGGSGIGLNGGSGRAVVLGGYHVKGIGRTPLVSSLTPRAHASGGAYLEECVRETIFSEIVRREFPCSAVPVLAIIDTGLVQVWETEHGPKHERRTLLVRPNMIRPAHFARAVGFYSGDPNEGGKDARRVEAFFANATALFGKPELTQAFHEFSCRWAQQMAHAFVHRMPHGSNTISNVCMDGSLLDFGASSALPSWASISTMRSAQPFAGQFAAIRRAIHELAYYFGRYLDAAIASDRSIEAQCANAQRQYRITVVAEALRLCGVDDAVANLAAQGPDHVLLWNAVVAMIAHFQREAFDLQTNMPPLAIQWDVARVWDDRPPAHLAQWKSILGDYVIGSERSVAAARCRFRTHSRSHLYREDAKASIYATLRDMQEHDRSAARTVVSGLICDQIARGRRNAVHGPDDGIPSGFAVNADASFALYRDCVDGTWYAVEEEADRTRPVPAVHRLPIRDLTPHHVRFQADCHPPLRGAVVTAGGAPGTAGEVGGEMNLDRKD